jgi:hypothetical protein
MPQYKTQCCSCYVPVKHVSDNTYSPPIIMQCFSLIPKLSLLACICNVKRLFHAHFDGCRLWRKTAHCDAAHRDGVVITPSGRWRPNCRARAGFESPNLRLRDKHSTRLKELPSKFWLVVVGHYYKHVYIYNEISKAQNPAPSAAQCAVQRIVYIPCPRKLCPHNSTVFSLWGW